VARRLLTLELSYRPWRRVSFQQEKSQRTLFIFQGDCMEPEILPTPPEATSAETAPETAPETALGPEAFAPHLRSRGRPTQSDGPCLATRGYARAGRCWCLRFCSLFSLPLWDSHWSNSICLNQAIRSNSHRPLHSLVKLMNLLPLLGAAALMALIERRRTCWYTT
jgi:hypothetical protein